MTVSKPLSFEIEVLRIRRVTKNRSLGYDNVKTAGKKLQLKIFLVQLLIFALVNEKKNSTASVQLKLNGYLNEKLCA